MAQFSEITSCQEVDQGVIDDAFAPASGEGLRPRERVLRLLERMARVAKPGASAYRILEIVARLAAMDWFDGPLDVVIRDFGLATELELRIDRQTRFERVRAFSLAVPLEELSSWALANPDALAPLAVFGTPSADELRLRLQPGQPSQREDDPHRRETQRAPAGDLPKEAFPPAMPNRPTIRVPQVERTETEDDPSDDGWND